MYHHNHKNTKQRGAAILIAVLFFIMISLIVVIGASTSVTRDYASYREFKASKKSYYLAEAGVEDLMYRWRSGLTSSLGSETMSLDGNTVTTERVRPGIRTIVDSVANASGLVRSMNGYLYPAIPTSFPYAVQIGPGGLEMENSAQITGDVFASGPIEGESSASLITGNVFSTGITSTTGVGGSIYGIKNEGTSRMLAETIDSSQVAGKPYCTSAPSSVMGSPQVSAVCTPLYNLTQGGTLKSFPISEASLDVFQNVAVDSSTAVCSSGKYVVNGIAYLGPLKIPCNLEVNSGARIFLTGPIWVTGTIWIKSNAQIRAAIGSSYSSVLMAAPSSGIARETGGTIEVESNVLFQAASGPLFYPHIILISRNTGASVGNGIAAINIKGSANNVVAYSNYGEINLTNSATAKQVTGYKVSMKNSARVDYVDKLQNLFINGGAIWHIDFAVYDLREVPDP